MKMRLCMTCVYWTLLLISVVSSGLLFLIVASETAQTISNTEHSESTDSLGDYDNVSLNAARENILEPSGVVIPEAQGPSPLKTDYQEEYHEEEGTTVSASFEGIVNDEGEKKKDLDILGESLIQQPNLSQGISETGQAVVLTLVDTAAAELQNLAEPKIAPEFRARPSTKNSSILTNNGIRESEELSEIPPSTQIPSPPLLDDTTERPNDTESQEDEVLLVQKSVVEEVPEVVVVVRAEQKVATDTAEFKLDDDVVESYQEDIPKVEDVFTPAPELNDSAARAQLVGGSRDDAAAVILDGIVTGGPTDPHEDIPSFSEWAQKRLEEAEKKKTHPNASVQNPGGPGRAVSGMKVRSKNYASPDCGAKVVAANPEAQSARSVLVSTRDEYMLNTCTSRIWFVVELCEAIQAKKIELANFELFSSSPKDFTVYVSDRFPTKEWSPVGQFTAKDMKDIQSFALHPHLFGKFIKVETHSHYGSEHYCPISLFRAYGTSEFEVLETETENQVSRESTPDLDDDEDSDEEELLDSESGQQPSSNLFGSARDAVLSIVKKAAEVLVKSSDLRGNNITEIQHSIDKGSILENSYTSCTTPRYTILCGNCSDQKFAKVFQLVSCRERQLDGLLKIDFVNDTLRRSRLCSLHGVEIDALSKKDEVHDGNESVEPARNLQATFLSSVFKPEYIVALCNVLATKERKVVMNTSNEAVSNTSEEPSKEDILNSEHAAEQTGPLHPISTTCTLDPNLPGCRSPPAKDNKRKAQETTNQETEKLTTAFIESSPSMETIAAQIKPTKTLTKEDLKKDTSIPILEPSKEPTESTVQAEVLTTIPPPTNIPTLTPKIPEEQHILGTTVETSPQTVTSVPIVTIDVQDPSNDSTGHETEGSEPVQTRIEKESIDQEVKQGKVDFGEQEVKLPSTQDTIAFDSLLSDFKDFEGDAMHLQNGAGASSSSTAQQPTSSTTPQKESVFLRLSNRIKALERNMSLSGQYLEELSRRYKKQVEEMQRSLERAVSAMGEESRKGEEREVKRLEEIAALREEIAVLSKSVENLFYERDSWRARLSVVGQHALLIILEVIIVFFVLAFCRKSVDWRTERQAGAKKVLRRKSAENFGAAKKTKKRRPSEIASHITGTYDELMIEDKTHENKKEKKKRRKREAVISQKTVETNKEALSYKTLLNIEDSSPPSRRASSIDPPNTCELRVEPLYKRPESAPETNVCWFVDLQGREWIAKLSAEDISGNFEKNEDSVTQHFQEYGDSNLTSQIVNKTVRSSSSEPAVGQVKAGPSKGSGILKTAKLSSPSFMKTALGTRKKRKLSSNDEKWELGQETGHFNQTSLRPTVSVISATVDSVNGGATNGVMDESDESRSSSATPTPGKKEKKSTGLKKMVRKLF